MMNALKRLSHRSSADHGKVSQEQDVSPEKQEAFNPTTQANILTKENPTVIEVFQSQGCNSCPPTNSLLLSKMAQDDPNVLILDYHVTYWDYLGWKDPFGVRENDDYQREYAHARGTSRVYTPQVVVNGTAEGVGNSERSLGKLIEDGELRRNQRVPWVSISQTDGGVLITDTQSRDPPASTERRGRVLEVIYDPAPHDVHIPRGENSGRTLTQRNTVRSVREVGIWTEGQGPIRLSLQKRSNRLRRVLIVQEGKGGPIIGCNHID